MPDDGVIEEEFLRLCYVDGPWAWFTSLPLDTQWGDDWNDAPYEHNAGEPYEWREGRGLPPYRLVKVAWDGPLDTPDEGHSNSPWSVQEINAGKVPWLETSRWARTGTDYVKIDAGRSLTRFCQLVKAVGGHVYVEAA